MATTKATSKDEGNQPTNTGVTDPNDPAVKAGELVGKAVGRNIDSSFHDYAFTDANTGEPIPVRQVVHDVPVGVNDDGSLEMKSADEAGFAQHEGQTKSLKETTTPGEGLPTGGADTKQSEGANQGESGERGEKK